MPVIQNAKQEKFAQELANGHPTYKAYVLAGYKENRANASVLKHKDHISQRVSELLLEREKIHAQSTADAIEATALTKEWVIKRLIENANRAMQAVPVTDHDGNETGEFQYEGTVANRALELLGKELGMFIERSEHVNKNYDISAEPVTDEQWAADHVTAH